jgi:tetratricopeptide (TPR) repeat protein
MAPEQARGDVDVGPAADVFSLGCVLYECLTGRPAFVAAHAIGILAKVLFDEVPNAADVHPRVPTEIADIVARMLSKEAAARFEDGSAVAAELARCHMTPRMSGTLRPKLGTKEHRLVSVVVTDEGETAPTLTPAQLVSTPAIARLRVEKLANGARVAVLMGEGSATDAARLAVRSALALRQSLAATAVAVATGRAVVEGRLPVGEAIDRAVTLFKRAKPDAVRVDDVTAGLLDSRFEVRGDEHGLFVSEERSDAEPVRTLMGRPTPCVGRERELAMLDALYEGCTNELASGVTIVVAPPGAGKSRVVHEWLSRLPNGVAAGDRESEVWRGSGDPVGAGSPFALVGQMLRRAAGVRLGEPIDQARAKLRARVARHVAEKDQQRVAEFLGEACGVPFPDETSELLKSARRDEQRLGDQMLVAWLDFVEAETGAGPVVIVLEDLHWGDAPTVRWVDAALRVCAEKPLVVVAIARPEVTKVFPDLFAERSPSTIVLGALGKRAAEKLVRQALGATDDATVAHIVDQAAGSALLLEELIRARAEGRAEGAGTVLAILQARLDALPEDARRVLRAASIFGTSFWKGGIAKLASGNVDAGLAALVSQELVIARAQSRFAGETELAFRHALVHEAAYATLVDVDRALGHRLAGDWLERVGERDSAAIAEHFEKGGERTRALGWWRRAAEDALAGSDCIAAVARADRAIACGAEGQTLGELRWLQSRAHFWLGQTREELDRASEALALVPETAPAWFHAAGELASACQRAGAIDRAIAVAGAVLRARVSGDDVDAARGAAAARFATVVELGGERDLAASLREVAERAANHHAHDDVLRARYEHAIVTNAKFRGALGVALRAGKGQREAWSRAGDVKQLAGADSNIGDVYMHLGRYAEAEVVLREVLTTSERLGLRVVAALAHHNLGFTLARLGRLQEARVACETAVREFEQAGVRTGVQVAHIYLADVLRRLGDSSGAEREARTALDTASTPSRRARALAVLARTLLERGEATEALEHARSAMSILEASGMEEGEEQLRLVHIEALEAAGDPTAPEAAARANAWLTRRAVAINEADLRQSFLENVEEHARIASRV